jgi:hypothetical protein
MVSSQGVLRIQTKSSFTSTVDSTVNSTVNLTVDLVAIARQYRNTPEQNRLVRWLQASTGSDKQTKFALAWRKGKRGGAIDFIKAFQSYQALPHQDFALLWLQQNSEPKTLQGFAKMWGAGSRSTGGNPPIGTKPAIVVKDSRLKVPFYPQTDNKVDPLRTCNTSSCAMVARYFGAQISGDDQYFDLVAKYGDTTDHTAQTKALTDLGIQSTWHTNLDFVDLDKSLAQGFPIVIGILHRGSLTAPTGGHVIAIIGLTGDRSYICNDPFGSLHDGYTGKVSNGNGVVYARDILVHRWLVEGNNTGWGRLFYGNRKPS